MARQITLDAREWIEIVNSQGELTGGFWWNPSDLDIAKRCEKVMEFFENVKISGNGGTEKLYELSDEIKEQFDYLLSPGASDELFKYSNPLSPRSDGALYAEYVLDILVKYIESELNVRMGKTNARIQKYTDKYKK